MEDHDGHDGPRGVVVHAIDRDDLRGRLLAAHDGDRRSNDADPLRQLAGPPLPPGLE
ncbi:MAG: hypothetical protein HQ464_00535 [Planctomycetes bacterium]|nr:hypothetical protein [Planctomycetota bacterium]